MQATTCTTRLHHHGRRRGSMSNGERRRNESLTPTPTSCPCSRARFSPPWSPTSKRTASWSRSPSTRTWFSTAGIAYGLARRPNRAAVPQVRRRRPTSIRAVPQRPPAGIYRNRNAAWSWRSWQTLPHGGDRQEIEMQICRIRFRRLTLARCSTSPRARWRSASRSA